MKVIDHHISSRLNQLILSSTILLRISQGPLFHLREDIRFLIHKGLLQNNRELSKLMIQLKRSKISKEKKVCLCHLSIHSFLNNFRGKIGFNSKLLVKDFQYIIRKAIKSIKSIKKRNISQKFPLVRSLKHQ